MDEALPCSQGENTRLCGWLEAQEIAYFSAAHPVSVRGQPLLFKYFFEQEARRTSLRRPLLGFLPGSGVYGGFDGRFPATNPRPRTPQK